jgi:hypothetical protein
VMTPVIVYDVESLFDIRESRFFALSNTNIAENSKPNWEAHILVCLESNKELIKNKLRIGVSLPYPFGLTPFHPLPSL